MSVALALRSSNQTPCVRAFKCLLAFPALISFSPLPVRCAIRFCSLLSLPLRFVKFLLLLTSSSSSRELALEPPPVSPQSRMRFSSSPLIKPTRSFSWYHPVLFLPFPAPIEVFLFRDQELVIPSRYDSPDWRMCLYAHALFCCWSYTSPLIT